MSFESGSSPLLNAIIYSKLPLSGTDVAGKGSRLPPSTVPLSSGDEAAWQQVKDSSRIGDLERFVGEYPNTSHRAEAQSKLEDLYWSAANNSGTISGYRDYLNRFPNSKYSQSAKYDIAKLDFEAAVSSKDPAVLRDFLARNPSGEYHERVAERLDDLAWANTESSDAASLNTYLSRFPGGRHADQARSQIAALTRASESNANKANVERTIPAVVHDKSAVLKLVHQYQQAYQNESVDQLKALWPNMGEPQIRALNDFFGHAQLVKLDYMLNGDPIIADNSATLKLTQTLTYVAHATNNTVSSKTKLIMYLRRQASDSSDWRIESIR
jgi:outer membrane protein assembly factor BamD (BamD/ComL family)